MQSTRILFHPRVCNYLCDIFKIACTCVTFSNLNFIFILISAQLVLKKLIFSRGFLYNNLLGLMKGEHKYGNTFFSSMCILVWENHSLSLMLKKIGHGT